MGRRTRSKIIDQYTIISTLSQHPHSTVWLAEHNSLSVPRIIKGIPKSSRQHEKLIMEAHLMKHLNHPGIPIIYDIFEDESYTYIVEQYIEGESLEALVRKRLLSEKEVFLFIIRICSIIEYLHGEGNILHLDIKPDNIIIAKEGPVLVDFGSAINLDKQDLRVKGYSKGFAPPEQLLGRSVNRSSDVYALGELLRFMADHALIRKSLRDRLGRIAGRCTAPIVFRPGSADILKRMLEGQFSLETNQILSDRPKKKARDSGAKRIGLAGLVSGVGVTHIALTLASYLADYCGLRVCLVEKTGRTDYSYVDFHETVGITFVPGIDKLSEAEIRISQFDYILYDLGTVSDGNITFLKECDRKIVIGSAAPWHRKQYEFLPLPEETGQAQKGWYVLSNLANPNKINISRTCCGHFTFPYEPNPLNPGKKVKKLFEIMMK